MAEFRHLVRIANTDLQGKQATAYALSKVKGIGLNLSFVICKLSGIDINKKVGDLTDAEIAKLNSMVKEPHKQKIPNWMLNRRKDLETGEDLHLIGNDMVFVQQNDIKLMRKLKNYRGVRHALKLPVRGQKTRSNFRPNKGKVTGVKTAGKKKG